MYFTRIELFIQVSFFNTPCILRFHWFSKMLSHSNYYNRKISKGINYYNRKISKGIFFPGYPVDSARNLHQQMTNNRGNGVGYPPPALISKILSMIAEKLCNKAITRILLIPLEISFYKINHMKALVACKLSYVFIGPPKGGGGQGQITPGPHLNRAPT